MKKGITLSSVVIALGLLIALGPQFLFKVCDTNMASSESTEDCCAAPETSDCCSPSVSSLPVCHWTGRAEIGIGFLIAALGACMIVFTDLKTWLGLYIGTFFASIIVLVVPHILIGGCASTTMRCHRIAFPALTVESIILLVLSVVMMTVIVLQSVPKKADA